MMPNALRFSRLRADKV